MPAALWSLLVALQIFHLLFLCLHDWVQLGNLNEVSSFKKSTTTLQKMLWLLVLSVGDSRFCPLRILPASHFASPSWPFTAFYFLVSWKPGGFLMPLAQVRSASNAIERSLAPILFSRAAMMGSLLTPCNVVSHTATVNTHPRLDRLVGWASRQTFAALPSSVV
jgi:hypothetical protein